MTLVNPSMVKVKAHFITRGICDPTFFGSRSEIFNIILGYVYYWADVGWLLGANTFTYSYYSDGIGERCPQHAPKNWTNEVFGTQVC